MREVLTGFIDPRPLAVGRIFVGLASLGFTFEWKGVLTKASSGDYLALPVMHGWEAPSPTLVSVLFVISLSCSTAMVLGFAGRLPAVLVALTTASALLLDQQAYSNHLVLLMMLALFFGLSGCTHALSISRRPRQRIVPYWPAFLIKVQITTLYAWTAISKINPQYLSGEVLGTYLNPWVPIRDSLLPAAAILSIVAEAFLALALWIPRTRKLAFLVGAALHIGIVVMLASPVPLIGFGMLMLSGYVLFAWGSWRPAASGQHAKDVITSPVQAE